MARVPYYVNDALGALLKELGLSGYELLGGHYAFTSVAAYDAAVSAAYSAIWNMYDDDDEDNDETADEYLAIYTDITNNQPSLMYWSTEKAAWV